MGNIKSVTLTVNECSEFHSMGESHENIKSVDEAIRIWKKIPSNRMNGIKSIGVRVADKEDMDNYSELDVVRGKFMDLDMLPYYPDIVENQKAMELIKELVKKLPELEMIGKMPEETPTQISRPRLHR